VTIWKMLEPEANDGVNFGSGHTHGMRFKIDKAFKVTKALIYAYNAYSGIRVSIWRVSDGVKVSTLDNVSLSGLVWNSVDVSDVTLEANVEYYVTFWHPSTSMQIGHKAMGDNTFKSVTIDGFTFSYVDSRAFNSTLDTTTDLMPNSSSNTYIFSMGLEGSAPKTKIGTVKAKKGDGTIIVLPIYDIGVGGLTSSALRTKLANGKIGALDLVPTTDASASPFRIYHGGAIKAIQKE
jgi:hypothetical protein